MLISTRAMRRTP